MLNVLIPEPVPSLNKGELAILEGIRESLRVYGNVDLTVYSPPLFFRDDKRNASKQYSVVTGVDLYDLANNFLDHPVPRSRLHFFETWGRLYLFSFVNRISTKMAAVLFKDDFLKAIAGADLILAGHDGMMGAGQFHLVLAGRIMKKPVALFGGSNDNKGRGNIKTRKYLQYAINKSILCTVRDPGFREFLVVNGVSSEKVHLFPDPAVMLKPSDDDRVNGIFEIEGIPKHCEKPLYGLIPVRGGIVFDKAFSFEQDLVKKYRLRVELWVEILKHLLDITDAHFIFLPHCIGPVALNDDRMMSKEIYNNIPYAQDRMTFIKNEYSAAVLKGIIRSCEYVLGERAHGLIGSVSSATPCLALTVKEDLRMHWLMENMFGRKTFNLNDPDIHQLKELLTHEWDTRLSTASQMKAKSNEIHKEAIKAAELLAQKIRQNITSSGA